MGSQWEEIGLLVYSGRYAGAVSLELLKCGSGLVRLA